VDGGPAHLRTPALDEVRDADHRAILATGGFLAMGPQWLAERGAYAMAVSWDGVAFRVIDACQDVRGTFASWPAAERMLSALAAEWDAEMTTA
jgi:hypothetical protein